MSALLGLSLVLGINSLATAETLFVASENGVILSLTNEPCKLEAISNLPYRATWQEKEKSFDGCWAASPQVGLIVAYFADKTVAIIPTQAFKAAKSI